MKRAVKILPSTHACQYCCLNMLCQSPLSAHYYSFINQSIDHYASLQKGEVLFEAEQPFEKLAVLRTGKMIALGADMSKRDVVGFYLATELIGLEGLARGYYPATVQALNTAVFCYLDYASLLKELPQHPEIYQPWLDLISRGFCQKERVHPHHSAEECLITFLGELSRRFQQAGFSGQKFELPMSQKDIANYLGLTAETLSRLFSLFKARMWLNLECKTITLLPAFFKRFTGMTTE